MTSPEVDYLFYLGHGESDKVDVQHKLYMDNLWVVGTNDNDESIQTGLANVQGKIVEVRGSKAGFCVERFIKKALLAGAQQILVDLTKIHIDELDDVLIDGVLRERAYALGVIKNWQHYPTYKDRIKVSPSNLWKQV